jgi:hypothetical protein
VAEDGRTVPDRQGPEAGPRGADLGATEATETARVSRLRRRLGALEHSRWQPEPISVISLLTTQEIRRALALTERGGVMSDGGVRHPEAFRQATPQEWEALERWTKLCGEPLDHLELAEELVDRMGEAHGWRSREAMDAALLLKRLELPNESPWYVGKMAEAVLSFYAVVNEHPDEPGHPKVRGAVRRLQRLREVKETERLASRAGSSPEEDRAPEKREGPPRGPAPSEEPPGPSGSVVEEPERAHRLRSGTGGVQAVQGEATQRPSWWRRVFGG